MVNDGVQFPEPTRDEVSSSRRASVFLERALAYVFDHMF
jgi:hypothetical protein